MTNKEKALALRVIPISSIIPALRTVCPDWAQPSENLQSRESR